VLDPAALRARLDSVRERIADAARRVGRDPAGIRLVAISKTFPVQQIRAAAAAGQNDFGENKVQEALQKIAHGGHAGLRWHLIGHLQSNKVKAALAAFDTIHSIDSLDLAAAVSRRATRPVDVLVEVNVAAEASKFGFSLEETPAACERVAGLPNLTLRGLMTVAPQTSDPETVRPVFGRLRDLATSLGLPELSMGMTDDFEVAIEEGATMVRVGRALFGPRPTPGEIS
jgi:pyridoxal phosphate enzyme (YggS family)